MRKTLLRIGMLLSLAALAACGDDFVPQPVHTPSAAQQVSEMQQQSAHTLPAQPPQVQAADSGPGWGGVAMGAAAGYLLGRSNTPQPQAAPPVQQVTRVVRETRYIERPAARTAPVAAAPKFTAPPAPAPKAVPKPIPAVVQQKFTPPPPAPTRYGGPSSYGSVNQSRPSFSRR